MTNTNTIDINNINFRDSGIYNDSEAFYQKHKNIFDFEENGYIKFEQYEKLEEENNYFEDEVEVYINELEEEDRASKDEDELRSEARDAIVERILTWLVYFEPQKFDKKIAKKCDLVAFTYKDIELLGLSGCGMDLSPRLDAYQALTTSTIDKYSTFFSQYDYFKNVVGQSVAEEVKQAITKYK